MKLSIITINFNNYEGLCKTINSILSQTWNDFEWIIIDGGSNDGSKELIETTAAKCSRITYWCSEPDRGVYNAMNKGIEKARGEYLNFMNSGDCYAYDTTLQCIMGVERKADILYGYMMRKTIDGECNNASMMKDHIDWYDFYFDTFPHQSSFIRKKLFNEIGFYDESYKALADWKFFIKAVLYNDATYEFIPEKLSIYECGGISDNEFGRIERSKLFKEMFPSGVNSDIELIKNVKKIQSVPMFRMMYELLLKVTNKWNRTSAM